MIFLPAARLCRLGKQGDPYHADSPCTHLSLARVPANRPTSYIFLRCALPCQPPSSAAHYDCACARGATAQSLQDAWRCVHRMRCALDASYNGRPPICATERRRWKRWCRGDGLLLDLQTMAHAADWGPSAGCSSGRRSAAVGYKAKDL